MVSGGPATQRTGRREKEEMTEGIEWRFLFCFVVKVQSGAGHRPHAMPLLTAPESRRVKALAGNGPAI
ncbi:hypothetical protein D5086_026623 [Populus alba]|uniref:Uncharacterized protein n=1 Tax=Populus alba TaxID=43335 RepID=A0ACC4B2V7_POPAL